MKRIGEFIRQHPILSYSIVFFLFSSWMALFFKPLDQGKLLEEAKKIISKKDASKKIKDVLDLNKGAIVTLAPNRFYSIDLSMKAKNDYTIDDGLEHEDSRKLIKRKDLALYLENDSVYYFFSSQMNTEEERVVKRQLSDVKLRSFDPLTIADRNAVYFRAVTDSSDKALLRIDREGDYEIYYVDEDVLRRTQLTGSNFASYDLDELKIVKPYCSSDTALFCTHRFYPEQKSVTLPVDSFIAKLPGMNLSRKTIVRQAYPNIFILTDKDEGAQKNFRIDLGKRTVKPLFGSGLRDYTIENAFYFEEKLCLSAFRKDNTERKIFSVDTVGLTELTSVNIKEPDLTIRGLYKVNNTYFGLFTERGVFEIRSYIFKVGKGETITKGNVVTEAGNSDKLLASDITVVNDTLYALYENVSDSGGYIIRKISGRESRKYPILGGNKGYFSSLHLFGDQIIAELRYDIGFIKLNINATNLNDFNESDAYANINLEKYIFEEPSVRYNSVLIIVAIVFIIILYILGYVIINDYVKNMEEDEHIKGLKKFFEIYPTLNYKLRELDRTLNKLRTRSDAMLLLGIVIGVFGVGAFLIFMQKENGLSKEWGVREVKELVSPIVLLIFIETLSFFFLRQYRLIYNDYKAYYKVFMKVCNYFHILELSNLTQGADKKIVISADTFKEINKTFLEEKFDLSAEDAKDVSIAGEEIIKKLIDKLPTG